MASAVDITPKANMLDPHGSVGCANLEHSGLRCEPVAGDPSDETRPNSARPQSTGQKMQEINVEVRLAASGEGVCSVLLSEGATVDRLKDKIRDFFLHQQSLHVTKMQQTLFCGDQVLEDNQVVADTLVGATDNENAVGLVWDPPEEFFDEVKSWRRKLSREVNPLIQEAVDSGVIPRLVNMLAEASWPELQHEAAWALSNVASGTSEQTEVVVTNGTVPHFVELLRSSSSDVREQVVWGLGNIAGDSTRFRDVVLASGALPPALDMFYGQGVELKTAVWAVSNFCRGTPPPPLETISAVLTPLAHVFQNTSDQELLVDICWTLSYISADDKSIPTVMKANVCGKLVELLAHPGAVVQAPALRAVAHLVVGDDEDTQKVLDAGFLSAAAELLNHAKKGIRKDTCWAIANIMAGSQSQVQRVIDAGIVPKLIYILGHDSSEIRREAAYSFSNALAAKHNTCLPQDKAYLPQVEQLVQHGCIEVMLQILQNCDDKRLLALAIGTLKNVVQLGEQKQGLENLETNPYLENLLEQDGFTVLELMQDSEDDDVKEAAVRLMELLESSTSQAN